MSAPRKRHADRWGFAVAYLAAEFTAAAGDWIPAHTIKARATAAGITSAELRDARHLLGIVCRRRGSGPDHTSEWIRSADLTLTSTLPDGRRITTQRIDWEKAEPHADRHRREVRRELIRARLWIGRQA